MLIRSFDIPHRGPKGSKRSRSSKGSATKYRSSGKSPSRWEKSDGAWGVKRVRRNLALGVRDDRLAGAREVGDEGKRSIGQSEEVRFDGVFVPSPVLGGVVDYQDGAVAAAVAVKQRDAFRLFGAGAGGNVENGR